MTDLSTQQSTEQLKPYKGFKRVLNPFFAMLLLFGLPYGISWYFIYSGDPVAFEKPNNHGELVSPIIPLGQFSLSTVNGPAFNQKDLQGNWSLFTVTSSCEQTCQEILFTIRQNRKAMAVNRKVIKPILLLTNKDALSPLPIDLSKEFSQLVIVNELSDASDALTKIFASVTPIVENSIFMIDPLGRLMMVYPAGQDHKKGLLKDMQRLLKVNKPDV